MVQLHNLIQWPVMAFVLCTTSTTRKTRKRKNEKSIAVDFILSSGDVITPEKN